MKTALLHGALSGSSRIIHDIQAEVAEKGVFLFLLFKEKFVTCGICLLLLSWLYVLVLLGF